MAAPPTIACLSSGKLVVKADASGAETIESRYGQELIEDALRDRQRKDWKLRSQTGKLMAGASLWGSDGTDPAGRHIHISGITHGDVEGELIYALETDSVGGLFVYDVRQNSERRLFHQNLFRARHLSRHPERPLLAFSSVAGDGTCAIGVIQSDGRDLRLVTEGDSIDEAPSWAPGQARLLYQSAGIGRDQAGGMAGLGPYAIHLLDLESEELETLREDPKSDFLLPRMTADGALYYIRRPYEAGRSQASLGTLLKDALLLPVRLVWALFGFLNLFSVMFSGKPLNTAGGPPREGPDPRRLMLWGKLIDAERAQKAARSGEPPSLVPKDWKLVRWVPGGQEEFLAEGVVSYDLCAEGVVFTNGSGVWHLAPDGKRRSLYDGKMIEHVAVVG